jgi:hypothetical protein
MARGTVAAELAQTLKSLAGKCCWGVSAGEGTGSVFTLSFGWKVPRVRPIANPHYCRDWGTGWNPHAALWKDSWLACYDPTLQYEAYRIRNGDKEIIV